MPKLVYTIEYENDLSSLRGQAKQAKQEVDKAMSGGSSRRGTRAINEQEEALKELRKELRRKISLVDADLRLGEKSQAEAEESIRKIKEWAEAQGAFNRESLVGAQNLKTFANAQNRAQTGFKGISDVSNRANQVLFDLNQGLQDLPFGMRGVGNNIPFVIQGFRRFGKAAREQGISPVRAFIQTLASPAGLIGTAAAVIPTLILFAQQWDLFGDKASKSKEAISGVIEQLGSLQSEINRFRGLDSLFNVEENLEQVRFLALVEEDIKDQMQQLLDEAAFQGTLAEALGGRGEALLSDKQREEFNELQAQLEQTEEKRLDMERNIRVAKRTQNLHTVQQKEQQRDLNKLLDKADKLEKDILKSKKEQLDFTVDTIEAGEDPDAQRKREELDRMDERKVERLKEEARVAQKLFELRRDFATTEARFRQKLNQQRLATNATFTQRRVQLEQQLTNSLNRINNQFFNSEVERERAIFDARKQFMQDTLQLERSVAQERQRIQQQLSQARIHLQQHTLNALTSLSNAFAEDSKGIAIAILAIEKGLAIAQAAKEGAEKAGRAQMIASYYQAQTITPAGPNPAAIAAAANAQAQVARIKGTTAATIAAIAATGIGEAASIALRGSRSQGTAAGGRATRPEGFTEDTINRTPRRDPTAFSPDRHTQVNIELRTEADSKVVSKKAEDGRKQRVKTAVRVRSD